MNRKSLRRLKRKLANPKRNTWNAETIVNRMSFIRGKYGEWSTELHQKEFPQ